MSHPRADMPRLAGDDGFTLIELLVVSSIIAILAAIGLPGLTTQRAKAQDSAAIATARTAQTALESVYTQTDTYDVTPATLVAEEPALSGAPLAITGDAKTYAVTVSSASGASGGGSFTISRTSSGAVERTCTNPGKGRCRSGGEW
jgi:type IV pilus assembly protein PilA